LHVFMRIGDFQVVADWRGSEDSHLHFISDNDIESASFPLNEGFFQQIRSLNPREEVIFMCKHFQFDHNEIQLFFAKVLYDETFAQNFAELMEATPNEFAMTVVCCLFKDFYDSSESIGDNLFRRLMKTRRVQQFLCRACKSTYPPNVETAIKCLVLLQRVKPKAILQHRSLWIEALSYVIENNKTHMIIINGETNIIEHIDESLIDFIFALFQLDSSNEIFSQFVVTMMETIPVENHIFDVLVMYFSQPEAFKVTMEDKHVAQFCNMESCEETGNLQQCASCKSVYYCCREHQVIDWPKHKKFCKQVKTLMRNQNVNQALEVWQS